MKKRISHFLASVAVLAIGLGVAAAPIQAQDDAAQSQQNIDQVEALFEGLNAKEFSDSFFSQYFAQPYHHYRLGREGSTRGVPSGLKIAFRELSLAFPDFAFSIDHLTADSDMVMVQYTFDATFLGTWTPWVRNTTRCMATRENVTWDGVYIFHLEDGLITEFWDYWDNPLVYDQSHHCAQ